MRKLFAQRARLVLYLEQSELDAMVANAKRYGQTLQEWVRGVLTSSAQRVEIPNEAINPQRRTNPARRPKALPLEQSQESRPEANTRPRGTAEICEHGKKRGELCYKCDPKMGYPKLN